jgi:hypothetical protein
MTERDPEVSSASKLDASPPGDNGRGEPALECVNAKALGEDYELAQRCAAGEVAAWEELYSRYHAPLLSSIKALLQGHSDDFNLVDEIAARVWYALVDNDGELLLRYDPSRETRLITFMRAVAKDFLYRHFRSERRRLTREAVACRDKPAHHQAELDRAPVDLEDFLDTLSAGDKRFYDEYLLDNPSDDGHSRRQGLSPVNIWQKTHRLYKRMLRFLGRGF